MSHSSMQTSKATIYLTGEPGDRAASLAPIQKMVQACVQCGTCSGSCPNAFAMDLTPRKMWRLVIMGQQEKLFASYSFMLCSACYACTLRCPRGLPLTDAMAGLKRIAAEREMAAHRGSTLFYRTFLESVRRHGRVREMEFMTLYLTALKNPLVALRFAPLGLRLAARRKIALQVPSRGSGKLESLFKRIEEMDATR